MKKVYCLIISLLILISLFTGCNNQSVLTFKTYDYFNTVTEIIISDNFSSTKRQNDFNNAVIECEALLKTVTETFSTTNEQSEVYKYNSLSSGESITVSELFKEVFNIAKEYYKKTDGVFNPTVLPILDAYKLSANTFDSKNPPTVIPTDNFILSLYPILNFDNVCINENLLTKNCEDIVIDGTTYSAKLDFGGFLKGYVVDEIYKILKSYNFSYGYVNIGSSSMRLLNSPKGEFNLSINNPRKEKDSNTILTLKCSNASVSTSGDNERFYEIDGKRYCHIINGKTFKPIETKISSVSIIGNLSALESDVLTTFLCAMEIEDCKLYVKNNLSTQKVFITYNGNERKLFTNDTSKFTINSTKYTIEQI